jgi:MFS family permease
MFSFRRSSHDFLKAAWSRIEFRMVGPLPADVRYNMRTELVATVAFAALGTVLAFIPVVLRQQGAPAESLALYTASAYLGNVLSPFGLLLIRPGYAQRLILIYWLIGRAAFLPIALATGYPAILGFVAVFWLCDGLSVPVYFAILQSMYPVEARGRVTALVRLGLALPMLILTPVIGLALDQVGYRVVFPACGLIGILGALVFYRLRVNEQALHFQQTQKIRGLWNILGRDRRFSVYLISLTLFGLSTLIPSVLFPLVQVDRLHLTYTELGWLTLATSVTRLLSYVVWGRQIDRMGGTRCVQLVSLINIVVIVPYIWATGAWALLPSFIAAGVVYSGVDLGFINALMQLADPERVSEYTALQSTIIGLRGMVGPFLGVGLLSLGLSNSAIFALSAGLALLAAGVLHGIKTPERQEVTSQKGAA